MLPLLSTWTDDNLQVFGDLGNGGEETHDDFVGDTERHLSLATGDGLDSHTYPARQGHPATEAPGKPVASLLYAHEVLTLHETLTLANVPKPVLGVRRHGAGHRPYLQTARGTYPSADGPDTCG